MQGARGKLGGSGSRPRRLGFAIAALAVVLGIVAWAVTRGGEGEPASVDQPGMKARIVSVSELKEFAASVDHGVYWVGVVPGKEIELRESAAGDVQLRYLREGTPAGGGGKRVLTIGTYPLADPVGSLEGFAGRKNAIVRRSRNGREVVSSIERPTSAYFADAQVQVEVYDPSYRRAMRLALSPRIRPVG